MSIANCEPTTECCKICKKKNSPKHRDEGQELILCWYCYNKTFGVEETSDKKEQEEISLLSTVIDEMSYLDLFPNSSYEPHWKKGVPKVSGTYYGWCEFDGDMLKTSVECQDNLTLVKNEAGSVLGVIGSQRPMVTEKEFRKILSHFCQFPVLPNLTS